MAWIALIFGTSCTVIRPWEFFALAQTYVFDRTDSLEQFKVFWGASWFVVVKGWHVLEFAILQLLCVFTWKWCFGQFSARTIVGAMLFCFLFAASDEWHQSFIPERFGTITDVFIDSLGIGIAGLLSLWHMRRASGT